MTTPAEAALSVTRAYTAAGLATTAAERKATPMATGLLDYFPRALAAVADLSRIGNDQHNPGEPLHWERSKSGDHADCLLRHLADRGTFDTDRVRHSTKVAWRALALLQIEIENADIAAKALADRVRGSSTLAAQADTMAIGSIEGDDDNATITEKWNAYIDRGSDADKRSRPWMDPRQAPYQYMEKQPVRRDARGMVIINPWSPWNT